MIPERAGCGKSACPVRRAATGNGTGYRFGRPVAAPVVDSTQVAPWSRDQRRESGQKLDRLEHNKMGGAVPVRGVHRVHPVPGPSGSLRLCKPALLPIFQLIHHLPCLIGAQPFQRQGGSGDLSTQPLDPVTLRWHTRHRRIQREPVSRHREWSRHARRGCRCGELECQHLTAGLRADGNAVPD